LARGIARLLQPKMEVWHEPQSQDIGLDRLAALTGAGDPALSMYDQNELESKLWGMRG